MSGIQWRDRFDPNGNEWPVKTAKGREVLDLMLSPAMKAQLPSYQLDRYHDDQDQQVRRRHRRTQIID